MSRWHRDNPELYEELGDEGYEDMLWAEADAAHERQQIARDEAEADRHGDHLDRHARMDPTQQNGESDVPDH